MISKFFKMCLCMLFCFSYLSSGFAANLCNRVSLKTLQVHLPHLPKGSKIVAKREVKGLCEVILKIKNRILPLYVGGDFVIVGQMFSHKADLTKMQMREVYTRIEKVQAQKAKLRFKTLRPKLDKAVAIVYKPRSTATHVMYMFTDPVCPFCHRAEQQIKQVADKYNVILKMVFYPVHLPKGKEMAIEAVCRKLDLDTYLKGDWKKESKTKEYQCKAGKQLLEGSMNIGKELGIRGVPTFFLENGDEIVGANIPKLQAALAKLTGK